MPTRGAESRCGVKGKSSYFFNVGGTAPNDAEEKGTFTKREVLVKLRRGRIQEFMLAPFCIVV